MRIVHAVCTDAFAGVERHIAVLARGQRSAGHQVAVVGGHPIRMPKALGPDIVWRSGSSVGLTVRRLSGVRDAEVVHAHMTAAETASVLSAPLTRAAVVSTRHFARSRGSNSLVRFATALTSRRLDAQISISRYVSELIDGPSTVVHPGVEPVECPSPDQRQPIVLMAQRLEPEKRTDLGIRIFAASGVARCGWQLLIAGGGSQRAATEKLASDLGIGEACIFLGDRDDIADLFASASILLAPCPTDGLGLSVLEAMSAGLPIVAAGAGGHLETVGAADHPMLYPPEDVPAGGRCLANLAANGKFRALYADVLRSVQREQFTVARQVEETLNVYRRVLR